MLGRFHWYFPRPLDVEAMRLAAKCLEGCHDFEAFQSLGSPRRTTVRTIHDLTISETPALEGVDIGFEVEADGFLYNMVRNIVGTLVDIGCGRFGVCWMNDLLESKDRSRAGQTAPPQGLCLLHVNYPEACFNVE
jgi:tRNA pseudouridine38-40 synthase